MTLRDYTIVIGSVVIAGLLLATVARGADDPLLEGDDITGQVKSVKVGEVKFKPPVLSDAQKSAAWKAQALLGMADTALRATKEYKEYEKRQNDLQMVGAQLQTACGEKFAVVWTPDDIGCVERPPAPPEAKK
jgi:hypothetical protein